MQLFINDLRHIKLKEYPGLDGVYNFQPQEKELIKLGYTAFLPKR